MTLLESERDAIKADALSVLRTALVAGDGIGEALRWCWYRNPAFSATLFTETVRTRFRRDCDVKDLTSFIARHRPQGSSCFPVREAEALMRAALGEVMFFDEVHPGRFSYPEIGIALLGALFGECRPGRAEIDDLIGQVKGTMQTAQEFTPGLRLAEEDWFAAEMHESPFTCWVDEDLYGR